MINKAFSIRECASYGWRATFSNLGLSFGMMLVPIGVQISLNIILSLIKPTGPAMWFQFFMLSFFSLFITLGMSLGSIRIALDLYDKGTSNVMRLFSCLHSVFKVWVTGIIEFIAVLVVSLWFLAFVAIASLMPPTLQCITMVSSGVFCVVTLWFLFLRTMFSSYRIIDKNVGVFESLLYSFDATKGLFWKLFGLFIVSGLSMITIIGAPAAVYMWAAAYRTLSEQTA